MTNNGPVRGEKRINSLYPDESFLAFHAIPYAEPPTGDKRFMHPMPHSNWSDVYDATNSEHKNKCCPQVNYFLNADMGKLANLYKTVEIPNVQF